MIVYYLSKKMISIDRRFFVNRRIVERPRIRVLIELSQGIEYALACKKRVAIGDEFYVYKYNTNDYRIEKSNSHPMEDKVLIHQGIHFEFDGKIEITGIDEVIKLPCEHREIKRWSWERI